MEKKKKIRKGDFGYISSQKKKRILYTVLAFIAPLTVFFTGLLIKGNRKYSLYSSGSGGLSARL